MIGNRITTIKFCSILFSYHEIDSNGLKSHFHDILTSFLCCFLSQTYRKTPNLVTATEPGTKKKVFGFGSRHQVFVGGVKFRLLGRLKTRKSRFLGLFYDLFWTRYKYRNYCSYLSKYWLLSKTNKCKRFLMPIIL